MFLQPLLKGGVKHFASIICKINSEKPLDTIIINDGLT